MTENQPRVIFERLFGDGGSERAAAGAREEEGSILDSVAEEASSLAASLGHSDRSKLSEYLDSVREVETADPERRKAGPGIDRAAGSSDRHSGIVRRSTRS